MLYGVTCANCSGRSKCFLSKFVTQAMPVMEFNSPVACCVATFLQEGQHIAAGYCDGSVRVFDVDAVSIVWTEILHSSSLVGIAGGNGGASLMSMSNEGAIVVTSVSGSVQVRASLVEHLYGASVDAMALSPVDGGLLAVAWDTGLLVCNSPWRDGVVRTMAQYDTPAPTSNAQDVRSWRPLLSASCQHLCSEPAVCVSQISNLKW